MIKKGMILAAGLGVRLRPLTNTTPKPLIVVGGRPAIEYNIMLLKRSGVEEIVVNLHHLSEKIKAYLGYGEKYGVSITYSYEPEILGTAGGIKNAERFFGGEKVVIVNTDLISDIDLKKVFVCHEKNNCKVTMVLRKIAAEEKYTAISARDGEVKKFGAGEFMYTGIQIIDPAALIKLPPAGVPSDLVRDLYQPMIAGKEPIGAYIHDGFWTEIGTLDQLKNAESLVGAMKLWYLTDF